MTDYSVLVFEDNLEKCSTCCKAKSNFRRSCGGKQRVYIKLPFQEHSNHSTSRFAYSTQKICFLQKLPLYLPVETFAYQQTNKWLQRIRWICWWDHCNVTAQHATYPRRHLLLFYGFVTECTSIANISLTIIIVT